MQVLSKEEEIKRCQDTVTRLILAFRGLDQHDRSGRSALEAKLEEEKSKLLSLGRMVTTVTGSVSLAMHARGHSNHVASAVVSDDICISPSAPSSVGNGAD